MNQVVIIGRLTKDVDLRSTQSGESVGRFTLAVDRQLSKEKKADFIARGLPTADFIPVVVWGAQARNCATYLGKGRQAAVSGRIQTGSYEKDGIRRYTTEVVASNVEFLGGGNRTGAPTEGGMNTSPQDSGMPFGGVGDFSPTDQDIPF